MRLSSARNTPIRRTAIRPFGPSWPSRSRAVRPCALGGGVTIAPEALELLLDRTAGPESGFIAFGDHSGCSAAAPPTSGCTAGRCRLVIVPFSSVLRRRVLHGALPFTPIWPHRGLPDKGVG